MSSSGVGPALAGGSGVSGGRLGGGSGVVPAAATFSDDFNRANNASLGAAWNDPDNFAISGNVMTGGSSSTKLQYAQDLTANHFVEIDVTVGASGDRAFLCCRWGDIAVSTFYRAVHNGTAWRIDRVVAGAATNIASVTEAFPSLPVRMRLQAVGTAIGLYTVAGGPGGTATLKASATDATIATGNQVGFFGVGGASSYDNFLCGLL